MSDHLVAASGYLYNAQPEPIAEPNSHCFYYPSLLNPAITAAFYHLPLTSQYNAPPSWTPRPS